MELISRCFGIKEGEIKQRDRDRRKHLEVQEHLKGGKRNSAQPQLRLYVLQLRTGIVSHRKSKVRKRHMKPRNTALDKCRKDTR